MYVASDTEPGMAMPVRDLQKIVYASLMAALIAVGAYIHVPIGPVPIVLQNLFVLLAALLFGPRWALASMGRAAIKATLKNLMDARVMVPPVGLKWVHTG